MFGFAPPFRIWFLLVLVIAAVLVTVGLVQAIRTEVRQARRRSGRARR
jgi:hypothetical protein